MDNASRMNTAASSSDKGPRSIERIMAILEALTNASAGLTLSEIAKSATIPKSSLVGLLGGLTEQKCLKRDNSGRYILGPRFLALAMRVVTNQEFVPLLHPILVNLVQETGETAIIASLVHDEYLVTFLDKVESPNSIRYTVTLGERRELHCTVAGKLFLAEFQPEQFESYLANCPRKRFTEQTLTGKTELRTAISAIRREGIARTHDERLSGASGLAAPIYSASGEVLAAMMLAGPTERMRKNKEKNEALVIRAAQEATRLLGGKLPDSDTV